MILKCGNYRNIPHWSRHLSSLAKNKNAYIVHASEGLVPAEVGTGAREALEFYMRQMKAKTLGTKIEDHMHIVSARGVKGDPRRNPDKIKKEVEIYMKEQGLQMQDFVIVVHEGESADPKADDIHWHAVISLAKDGKGIQTPFSRLKAMKAARKIEEYSHLIPFSKSNPQEIHQKKVGDRERQRGFLTGIPPALVSAELMALAINSEDGGDFSRKILKSPYLLAKGDRLTKSGKPTVFVVDEAGTGHLLRKRLSWGQYSRIIPGIDYLKLPNLQEARLALRAKMKEKYLRVFAGVWEKNKTGAAVIAAVENLGFVIAKGQKRDVFLGVDSLGRSFNIRRALGVKPCEFNNRMREVDRDALPSLQQAVKMQAARRILTYGSDSPNIVEHDGTKIATNSAGMAPFPRQADLELKISPSILPNLPILDTTGKELEKAAFPAANAREEKQINSVLLENDGDEIWASFRGAVLDADEDLALALKSNEEAYMRVASAPNSSRDARIAAHKAKLLGDKKAFEDAQQRKRSARERAAALQKNSQTERMKKLNPKSAF